MDIKEQFEQEFTRLVYNLKAINERWITIHPHGEDSEDYRRLKIEDGETPKEAIERVFKKDDKKQKSKEDLKKEQKQLYQDILKAKKDGNAEKARELRKRYDEIEEQLKGNTKKENTKDFSLLPQYANDFIENKKREQEAKEKYYTLLAEYQSKAKTDKKFADYQKQIDEIYDKMNKMGRYSEEFQKLINEKNKIIDEKHAYEKEFYKEVYAARDKYSELSTSLEKKDIIDKMSKDIKNQISKISSNNNKLVENLNKIDDSQSEKLKNKDKELNKQQDELIAKMRDYDFGDPERVKLRQEYSKIAVERGDIARELKELQYKKAQEVSKLLQVENGIKLNTKCSAAMQDITDKLKNCLDGVIPSDNYNNAEMTVRKHEGRAYQSGSTINISAKEDIGTAIHETMHQVEEHSEHVLMNSLAFATSRTEKDKQESLKRLTGLNYKANEVCKKDKFFNPYCGKLYDVFGGRNKTFINSRASEIMSMGIQELFTNPKEFAKNDREYFDFVVANLQGKLWN